MKYTIYTDGAYSQKNNEGAFAYVILSVDDADQKQLCERLCELREEFIRKLMDESGLWKHTENI